MSAAGSLDERLRRAGYASDKYTLKASQRSVLEWMERPGAHRYKGVIIAHEPGFGKTAAALARIVLVKEASAPPFRGALVICARSIIGNWVKQAAQYFGGARLRVAVLESRKITHHCGAAEPRIEKLCGNYRLTAKQLQSADVVLCTYEYPVHCFKRHGMKEVFAAVASKFKHRLQGATYDRAGAIGQTATSYTFQCRTPNSERRVRERIRDGAHLNALAHLPGQFGLHTDPTTQRADPSRPVTLPSWYRVRADMDNHLLLGPAMLAAATKEEVARREVPLFLAREWSHVVLDEAHGKLINPTSYTSVVCMALEATHKIILSGTPVRHHDHGLWPMMRFLESPKLPSYCDLRDLYSMAGMQSAWSKKARVSANREKMREYVEGLIHQKRHHLPAAATPAASAPTATADASGWILNRSSKAPIALPAPPSPEETGGDRRHADEELAIAAHDEWVNLFRRDVVIGALDDPLECLALENACDEAMYAPIVNRDGVEVVAGPCSMSFRRFGRIRQAVTDPALLPNTPEYPMRGAAAHSTKVRMLADYVCDRELVRADEKVLVFCTWTRTVTETARNVLRDHGIRSVSITGAMSNRRRDELLAEFAGDGCYRTVDDSAEPRVLLATYCLGEGVDRLKRANHVVFLNQDCVKSTHVQAVARAHRIGQQRDVHTLNLLVSVGVSAIDQRLLDIQENAGKNSRTIMDEVARQVNVPRRRQGQMLLQFQTLSGRPQSIRQSTPTRPSSTAARPVSRPSPLVTRSRRAVNDDDDDDELDDVMPEFRPDPVEMVDLTAASPKRKRTAMALVRGAHKRHQNAVAPLLPLARSARLQYTHAINAKIRARLAIFKACRADKKRGGGALAAMDTEKQWKRIKELERLRDDLPKLSRVEFDRRAATHDLSLT